MGTVIHVDFRNRNIIYLDEEVQIEIVDSETGDVYLYFELDMYDPMYSESFDDLEEMLDAWDPSDFNKKY